MSEIVVHKLVGKIPLLVCCVVALFCALRGEGKTETICVFLRNPPGEEVLVNTNKPSPGSLISNKF